MRLAIPRVLAVLCTLLGMAGGLAHGRDAVLSVIPSDAVGFAVIHNLKDSSHDIGELGKILKAPVPDVLSLAKGMTGLQKGIDEQGDLVIVATGVEPGPKFVFLAPVTSFDDFFAALKVKDPATGIADIQIAGSPLLVGRKGSYAAIAPPAQREALEKLIASTTNLTADKSLAEWVDANRVSVVLTSQGLKQVLPKLLDGIRIVQEQMRKAGGEGGANSANALNMYVDLFTASQKEVDQFGIGVRIDAAQTIDLVTRAELKEGGNWAKWAATAQPAEGDPLGGLEAKPLVMAMGGVVPPGAMKGLMKFSVKFMQNQPMYKLTPEQADKYADLAIGMMAGLKSARMLLATPEPGAGIYGNTSMVMIVDDAKNYLAAYEKAMTGMHELIEEAKNSTIPVATSKHIKVGEIDALEVSMTMPNMAAVAPVGGPDPQKMMQVLVGGDGKLKYYVAPADEHAVVIAYVSPERLKEAIEFYQSKKPGLSADAGVAKVAAQLPPGSQVVGYMSVAGVAKIVKQAAAAFSVTPSAKVPDFADSPPIGYAGKISPAGIEGHMVMTAETLRTIGDAVAKIRADAREKHLQQQQ